MKKTLFAVVLSFIMLLSGCAGFKTGDTSKKSVTEDGKVVIDFWTFWGSEIRRPIIEKIVDDFNQSQDKIVVKHTFVPWGDIWTKELAAIAAGNPPDVVINDINGTALRGMKKQAMDLSKFLKDDNIQDRFYPELWEATLYEGKSYGIPFNTDTRVLFYNKDAFIEAGLDPEKPPATWAELEEYAAKLDKNQGSDFARIGFYPLWGIGADVWMLNADGKNYIDEKGKPIIDTDVNLETLNWLKQWNEKYGQNTINSFAAQIDSQQGNPFFNGKLAMFANTPTFYTQIRDYAPDLNFGVAPLPERVEGSGHYSWGGGFVAEIPEGSKHAEEAWEFIKYLTDIEAQEYWAVKNFDNIANKEAAEKAAKNAEMAEKDKEVFRMAVDNMDNTLLTPMPVHAPNYTSLLTPEFDSALLGKKTPEQALEDAQKAVEKLIEKK